MKSLTPQSLLPGWVSIPITILAVIVLTSLMGCTGRPLVQGLFEPGGTIYRESEQEEWGSRSTVKIQGLEF